MNRFLNSIIVFIGSFLFALSSVQMVQAEELNMPGFTGTINTTVSSGFSMRVSDRDCNLLPGYSYTVGSGAEATEAGEGGATAATLAGVIAGRGAAAGAGDRLLVSCL